MGASTSKGHAPLPTTTSKSSLEMMEGGAAGKKSAEDTKPKQTLTFGELLVVLRPFFWPSEGSDGVFINRVRAVGTWVVVGGSKGASLASPYFVAAATNQLVAGDYASAAKSMIGFTLLRFASQFLRELQSILYIKVKQQASIELQVLTFSHLHNLSLTWHLTKKTGSVMKSMDRGTEAANTLITYLFLFLLPALAECLAVVILFFAQFQQWGLGVLVFSGVVLYSAATIIITQWRKKFREATNKHDNDFHDKAQDSILNFETVKYFTAEQFEVERFKTSVVKFQQYNSATQLSLSLLNISQQFILIGTLLGAMLISGQAVVNGEMSLGGWVAVQAWVGNIFVPLNFLGTVYAMIVQALVDIKNLGELLSEHPDIIDEASATPYPPQGTSSTGLSIEFKDVDFHYPEQPPEKGIRNLSISVPPGSCTAVVGPTGAGKTSLSRLLFRFYDPKAGGVLIGGKDLRKHTQQSVRKLIGIVPQDTVLFNDTIAYNIRYGRMDATQEEIEAAAESAQIKTFIESLPEGWNTVVGERGLKLSGGEKQRVSIARCLLKNPPIVLLDEATSALDTVTENSVQDALDALGTNRTTIIIAHRLSTIRQASQIIVLEAGQVAECGSFDELLAKGGKFAGLWEMQNRRGADSKVVSMEEVAVDSV
jgi:ABC-type transport system involved in Fe-S cluster assembly fused permease/ATPase subunit